MLPSLQAPTARVFRAEEQLILRQPAGRQKVPRGEGRRWIITFTLIFPVFSTAPILPQPAGFLTTHSTHARLGQNAHPMAGHANLAYVARSIRVAHSAAASQVRCGRRTFPSGFVERVDATPQSVQGRMARPEPVPAAWFPWNRQKSGTVLGIATSTCQHRRPPHRGAQNVQGGVFGQQGQFGCRCCGATRQPGTGRQRETGDSAVG